MHQLAKRIFKLGSQKIKTANVNSIPRNTADPLVPRPPLNQQRFSNPFVGGEGSFQPNPPSGLPFHETENTRRRRHRRTPPSPTPKSPCDKENIPPLGVPVLERRAKSPPLAPRRTESEQDASMAILLQTGEMARSSRRKKGSRHSRHPAISSSLFHESYSGQFTEDSVTLAEDTGPSTATSPDKKSLFRPETPTVVRQVGVVQPSPTQESLSWLSEILEQLDAMDSPDVNAPNISTRPVLPSASASFDSLADATLDFVVDRSSGFSVASPLGVKVAPATTVIPSSPHVLPTPPPPPVPVVKSVRFMDDVEMRQRFIGASDGKIGATPSPDSKDSIKSAVRVKRRYSGQWVAGRYERGLAAGDPLLEEYVRQLPRRDAIYWADMQWAGSSSQDVTDDGNSGGKDGGLRMYVANNDRIQLWRSLVPADALPFSPPTSPRDSYLF